MKNLLYATVSTGSNPPQPLANPEPTPPDTQPKPIQLSKRPRIETPAYILEEDEMERDLATALELLEQKRQAEDEEPKEEPKDKGKDKDKDKDKAIKTETAETVETAKAPPLKKGKMGV